MFLALAGFLSGSIPLLLAVLLGLGLQAAFFSPLKYGILPDFFEHEDAHRGQRAGRGGNVRAASSSARWRAG